MANGQGLSHTQLMMKLVSNILHDFVTIYFDIIAAEVRNGIKYSIELYHKFTCLKFVQKEPYHRDYIEFVSEGG